MITFIFAALLLFSTSAFANNLKEEALTFVPEGTIIQEKLKEFKVKTPQGSIVEVEFDSAGKFEEASGDNVEQDIFQPANGLTNLQTAIKNLKRSGKNPVGEWSFENSLLRGWHYEFEGFEKGQKFDYVVDGKTGKLVESAIDD